MPWSLRSTFMPDSTSSSRANSGYMRALAVASGCRAAGVSSRAIDQHAASGVRRFAAGLAPLDYNDTRAFAPELNRQREPNNAAADYDYIPIPHLRIVEESVTFVTRVVTLLPPIIRSNLLDNDGQENQPE